MIVTGFEKKGRKVLVHFDDGSTVILNYEVLLKNGIRKDETLSESRFSFICDENLKYDIKHCAFNLLSRRLHSTSELKIKLKQKFRNYELIEEVIAHLSENKYLDDNKFTSEFVAEKSRTKLWGSRKISAELKRRGIDYKIADEDSINNFIGENITNLKLCAEKKLKSLKNRNTPENKLKLKMTAYLLGKGFSYDEIKNVVDNLLTGITEEE
jgi:regulatory protein